MAAIITDQIRILNAKNFVAGVSTSTNSYYSFVGLTGLGTGMYFGDYSYGRLQLSDRNTVRSYPVNTSNGVTGILTGPIVKRQSFLKTQSYST